MAVSTASAPAPLLRVIPGARPAREPWREGADRLAESASRAAHLLRDVVTAEYRITGGEHAAELHLRCAVRAGRNAARTVETLTGDMVRDMEEMLGTRFTACTVTVDTVHTVPAAHVTG